MIKAIVVDDEALNTEYICKLIRDAGLIVQGYTNPYEALENIEVFKPDVLFLDIEMPEINGLQLAHRIQASGYECEIVFITAYNNYAINAFRVNAIDYLLKPIVVEELMNSIERVKRRRILSSGNKSNANKKIRIYLFGTVSIYVGDGNKPIRWTTTKCAEVIAFMLLQKDGKEISKWKLAEEIWPDKDMEKADINLRSTISRLNKTFRENSIEISVVSTGQGYKLKITEEDVEIDAFKFERALFKINDINCSNADHYESVILSYKYMLLEELNSEWCCSMRECYHRYFLNGARKLVEYYERNNVNPIKILNIIELVIKYEPYDEKMRERALKMHYTIEGRKKAEEYYMEYAKLLKKDLQIEPASSIKKLYRWILDQ